ncbi:unnamed protein product [Caenorhabditis angaria]|uniref:SXP/RAL-2 family protein Ani s 5-like cation-binding domain-containing protein n=1 Tax=Caenorhabditis angaria TaxID=860376 RepID=A0A9P1IET5_9PELO|nr:unnamed protein product [Caenorhabditis angaria]
MFKIIFSAVLVVLAVSQNTGSDVPPFLRRASQAQLQAFQALIQNHGHLTEAGLEAKVQQWAKAQGGNVAYDFAEFEKFVTGAKHQANAAHDAALAKFTPAARKADADLSAIAAQTNLPVREKGMKIQAYLNSLAPSVLKELQAAHEAGQGR